MNVLIADGMSDSFVSTLEEAGLSVTDDPSAKGDLLVAALNKSNADVLVVRSTRVDADALSASRNLQLVVRAGAGYDTIDVEAASARGIFVANCPGKNATAVAELTLGLILALDRFLPDNVIDARAGRWHKAKYSKARGLKGRVLGLIGFGSIGSEVAERAAGFGLGIVAWSRSLTPDRAREAGVQYAKTPGEVAEVADIVSVHVASNPATRGMIGADFFSRMKPGAFFVNTTRSAVVDEKAMLDAIEQKGIRVALDVFDGEPTGKDGPFDAALARHPNVYLSHHIGASTDQAQEAIADESARIILVYNREGRVPNCVNLADQTPATHQITVRHLDKVGVLARVFNEMGSAGWNVQEMENLIFSGAVAACARIRFAGEPDDASVEAIAQLQDVLAVTLIKLDKSPG